jgi:hypothetical protein
VQGWRAERALSGALGSVGERQKKMNRAHLQLEVSKPAPQVAENNEQSTRTGREGLGNHR